MKSKRHKQARAKAAKAARAHLITKLDPKAVALVAKVDPERVYPETHYVAAIPKSSWQKFKEYFGL